MVFAASNLQKVFFPIEWTYLAGIDTLDRIIGVTQLALGCQAPTRRKVLLLVWLLLDLLLVGTLQGFLGDLVVVVLLLLLLLHGQARVRNRQDWIE